MELFYAPMAGSLPARVVCLEAGLPVVLRRVDRATKAVEGGGDLREVDPMGQVPTLLRDDGTVLTENVAILLYLADLAPAARLAPPPDSPARYETVRWLSFVATEIHKRIGGVLFSRDAPDEAKAHARASAAHVLSALERRLAGRETLASDAFGVADAYLAWALAILPFGGVPLDGHAAVGAYAARHLARESLRSVIAVERREYRAAS